MNGKRRDCQTDTPIRIFAEEDLKHWSDDAGKCCEYRNLEYAELLWDEQGNEDTSCLFVKKRENTIRELVENCKHQFERIDENTLINMQHIKADSNALTLDSSDDQTGKLSTLA